MHAIETTIAHIDKIIRCDVAQRGLLSSDTVFGPTCPEHLAGAAAELSNDADDVLIATGFFIDRAEPPSAETDGPPGAVVLADALLATGIRVRIAADSLCAGAVAAAIAAADIEVPLLTVVGNDDNSQAIGNASHVIAIECPGRSHTSESVRRQNSSNLKEFEASVPAMNRGQRHTMFGRIIPGSDVFSELFEFAMNNGVRTIGIGDGGNEIGMGVVDWSDLRRRVAGSFGHITACQVATHWNIVAGTSNWGAWGLAAALLLHHNRTDLLGDWSSDRHRVVLERMVSEGPAVDGVTRESRATVDGLEFEAYMAVWHQIVAAILSMPEDSQVM